MGIASDSVVLVRWTDGRKAEPPVSAVKLLATDRQVGLSLAKGNEEEQ
jgi:hypothetical protein